MTKIESTDVFDTRCVLFKNVYACMISAASLGLYKTALFSVTVISLFLCFTQFLSVCVINTPSCTSPRYIRLRLQNK